MAGTTDSAVRQLQEITNMPADQARQLRLELRLSCGRL